MQAPVFYNRRTAAPEAQQPPRGRFRSRSETVIKAKRKGLYTRNYATTHNGHFPTETSTCSGINMVVVLRVPKATRRGRGLLVRAVPYEQRGRERKGIYGIVVRITYGGIKGGLDLITSI
jgi:hypothetical protein